jgi:NAD(P)-dependent dehydrogenase (short-subunit alcohol dehydrogenase family)
MQDNFALYPSLKDIPVIVTGGASGIGEKIVRAFVLQDSRVAFIDFDKEASQKLQDDLDGKVDFEICDLTETDSLKDAFISLSSKIGKIGVLVNNAARDDRHNWKDVTSDYFDERVATNLKHQFFAIQAVAPDMIERGGGSIVNLGSNSWWEAGGGFPIYATSKAAIHGLTRTMARDLGQHRIRVNTVVPGWIMTDRQKELWVTEKSIEKHRDRQCLPDLIDPVYVARMVLFLASSDSAMCTANNYMVEAGSI